jgi:hypothetical protein
MALGLAEVSDVVRVGRAKVRRLGQTNSRNDAMVTEISPININ